MGRRTVDRLREYGGGTIAPAVVVGAQATDPDENHNLYGKPAFEALTARLKSRLEELRRETGDNYHYIPSRSTSLMVRHGGCTGRHNGCVSTMEC